MKTLQLITDALDWRRLLDNLPAANRTWPGCRQMHPDVERSKGIRLWALRLTSLTCLLALSPSVWSQTYGPHKSGFFGYDKFIDPAVLMRDVCSPTTEPTFAQCEAKLEQETAVYYKAIGVLDANGNPTAARGTFGAWKTTMGFGADPHAPVTDEIRATYFNNGDLQLGRDMHCRVHADPASRLAVLRTTTYACYVSNYSNSGHPGASADPALSVSLATVNTVPRPVPLATVVMEVTLSPTFVVSRAGGAGTRGMVTARRPGDVRFFAYDGNGNPLTGAILDSEGPKALPGVCIACHGGDYRSSKSGTPRVTSSNFLPFDTAAFIFGNTGDLSAFSLREPIRRLNQFVKATQPARPTIVDLIDGWYHYCQGVNQSGCYEDENFNPFVPGEQCAGNATCQVTCPDITLPNPQNYTCGWNTGLPNASGAGPPFYMQGFYQQVVAKECRTCHVALADRFNVQNFAQWSSSDFVEIDAFLIHKMPFNEVAFNDFWSDKLDRNNQTAKDFLKGFYGCIPSTPFALTGDGTDNIVLQVIPNATRLGQVGLSMSVVNDITWWKGVKVSGLEASTQDSNKFDSILMPAAIISTAPVVTLEKAKVFGIHTGVQDFKLPNAQYTYDGCRIAVTWNKDG